MFLLNAIEKTNKRLRGHFSRLLLPAEGEQGPLEPLDDRADVVEGEGAAVVVEVGVVEDHEEMGEEAAHDRHGGVQTCRVTVESTPPPHTQTERQTERQRDRQFIDDSKIQSDNAELS